MSLREEIYSQLTVVSGASKEDLLFRTDEIIKEIEKQINKIPIRHDSNTVEEVNYTNGWNHALGKVREEMLK